MIKMKKLKYANLKSLACNWLWYREGQYKIIGTN